MDSHIFRRIAAELAPLLTGARVHKIYNLADGALLLVLDPKNDAAPHKLYLILTPGRDNPALFLAPEKPLTPEQPRAETMRLRKYIQGKHIRRVHSHWEQRSLVLDFSNPSGDAPLLLSLTLAPAPGHPAARLQHSIGTGPGHDADPDHNADPARPDPAWPDPAWPDPADLPDILANEHAHRAWPMLTPLLRKTLARLDPPEQAALLADLRSGNGDIFVYEPEAGAAQNAPPCLLSAWPLPADLRGRRTERIFPGSPNAALSAAQYCFAARALDSVNSPARALERAVAVRAQKSNKRLLARLDEEERKLRGWIAGQANAILLQTWLHALPKDHKSNAVTIETDSGPLRLELDPLLTVAENMEHLFRLAAKGKRGLAHLALRREELERRGGGGNDLGNGNQKELSPFRFPLPRTPSPSLTLIGEDAAGGDISNKTSPCLSTQASHGHGQDPQRDSPPGRRTERYPPPEAGAGAEDPPPAGSGQPRSARSQKPRFLASTLDSPPGRRTERYPIKDIAEFRSSDGFTILRGKNAAGNRALLKLASGHDYWLHAQNGPSAHTLLRRAHALVEVPEQSLLEAAGLTALKSAWKDDFRAEIMVALARDVRPVKGGAPGQVLVDKVARSLIVRPDPELETKLAVNRL